MHFDLIHKKKLRKKKGCLCFKGLNTEEVICKSALWKVKVFLVNIMEG